MSSKETKVPGIGNSLLKIWNIFHVQYAYQVSILIYNFALNIIIIGCDLNVAYLIVLDSMLISLQFVLLYFLSRS